jgi:tetratricopeptide (TPR) repeat protein
VLFDAEEALARGQSDKALIHASRAVKERPADLIARGLYERARRESLRGKRREKLDSKVQQARGLFDAGDFAAAEKIVGSARKLVPDHAEALALFSLLRDRRLQAPTAEAEAERELDRLARTQAHRDAEAARAALKAGWDFRAALMVRRALRHVPDDPELLDLLAQAQRSLELTQAERLRKHTLEGQIRRARGLVKSGDLEQARNLLRAVLKEDHQNTRARAAIQEVRKAWLERQGVPLVPVIPGAATPMPARTAVIDELPPPVVRPAPTPRAEAPARPRDTGRIPVMTRQPTPLPGPAPAIPPEILLPRTRRAYTPWKWIGGGFALLVGFLLLVNRPSSDPRPLPTTTVAVPTTAPSTVAPTPEPDLGPLAHVEPALRTAIEATLAAYTRALESVSIEGLAAARPDLSAEQRAALLKPYEGALNVATDLRVLDVVLRGDQAEVPVLRRDVIVGGRDGGGGNSVEETLRFTRRDGAWVLSSGS